MKHEINKHNMINDIILTVALVISIIITELIIHTVGVVKAESFFFFAMIFVLIKIIYNGLLKISKQYIGVLE